MSGQPDIIARASARIREQRAEHPQEPLTVILPHARLIPLIPGLSSVRYLTLTGWAEQQEPPLGLRVVSTLERISLVYQALRERGWFAQQDRWALSLEALKWVDELTQWGFVAPLHSEDFAQTLAMAYQSGLNEPLLFESRFILDLWQVLNANPQEVSDKMARQLRLNQAVQNPPPGHFLVVGNPIYPYERAALEHLATLREVEWLTPDTLIKTDAPMAALLNTAWQPEVTTSLRDRAALLAAEFPQSPLGGFAVRACTSMEQEARLACQQVVTWRESGVENIALVAQDRVVARRLRALLQEAGVPVFDESGWVFSTTAASTTVMRLLELLSPQGNYRTLEDVLHSPYLLPQWPPEKLNLARETLRNRINKTNWLSGLNQLVSLCELNQPTEDGSGEAALELARLLAQQAELMKGSARSLLGWMEQLQAILANLGILEGLSLDPAGSQLQDILTQFMDQSRHAAGRYGLGEFIRAVDHHFEGCTFEEEETPGAVRLTQLSLTRLRGFDAVLMVGADSAHLPALPRFPFFGESVRQALGLPGREFFSKAALQELGSLISRSPKVVISWQKEQRGEPNALSTPLFRLEIFHETAYGHSLVVDAEAATATQEPAPNLQPPAPSAPHLVPQELSASALNTLIACPYRYYARYMLGLPEERGVRDTLDKRDYGNTVHRILDQFHRQHQVLSQLGQEQALQELETLSRKLFSTQSNDPEQRAWCLRWLECVPDYITWCLEQEQRGWFWHAAEVSPDSVTLPLAGGKTITLRGRLDRIDRHEDGSLRILDYKLKDVGGLKRDLAEGEDEQLPFYGLLYKEATQAAFIPLEMGEIKPVSCDNLHEKTSITIEKVTTIFSSIKTDGSLPANGSPKACSTCSYSGLCRRQWWENP